MFRRVSRVAAADSRAGATGRPHVPTAIQVSPGPGVDEPRKKKARREKQKGKNLHPGVVARRRRATRRARSKRARTRPDSEGAFGVRARTRPKKIKRVRRGIEPTAASSAAAATSRDPGAFPFRSRVGCVARRRAIRATKTIAASSDIEKTQRNLGDRHKGARRRRARYRPQRRARDGRSARFARRLRRSPRRRHIKNQQNKPWVAAAYAPSFAVSVATTGAVFVSGAFVVSPWIDSRRVGVRENSGFGRDARARARRRRERWANGKRYRRWLEIARATRRGRAVPAPWPTPGPRVEGSGLLV